MCTKPTELVRVLMKRDDLNRTEAEEIVRDMKIRVARGEDPEEVLSDEVGLEMDYALDLY